MRLRRTTLAAGLGLSGIFLLLACARARAADPTADYKRACRIMERSSRSGGSEAVAGFIEALEMLTKIREDSPSWKTLLVERRISDCRRFIDSCNVDGPDPASVGRAGSSPGADGPSRSAAEQAAAASPGAEAPLGGGAGGLGHDELRARARRLAAAEGEIRESESRSPGAVAVDELLAPPVITFRDARPGRPRSYAEAAVERYEKARDLIREKDYNGAIGELREAVYLEGDYIEAFIALGEIYETVGQDGIAIEAYRSSLRIDDDAPDAHCAIGNILVREGMTLERESRLMEAWSKYQNAVMEYKRATWVNIGCAPAYYGIGVAYSRLGRHSDAAYYWKKTIEAAGKESEHGKRAAANLAVTGMAY